jgi:signal transduction histidine kinase
MGRDRQLGTLNLGLGDGRRWDPTERALAQQIGQRVALALDNARLQTAERQARIEAEQLAIEREAVLAHIADGVIVTSADGEIRFMNDAANSLLAGVHDPLGALELSQISRLGQTVEPHEIRLSTHQGELILACIATPLRRAARNAGMVVTLRNVTAERRLEHQKQEFFANASHDLRTPVATIKASIDVVLDNLPANFPAELAGLLENIDREAERMGSFVDDLLELARLEAGRVQLHQIPCDLGALVKRAARAIEPLAARRGQQVVTTVQDHEVPWVVDPSRLERALMNLLSNAQKYGRDGGRIEIRLDEHPSTVLLVVQDDGPGIAPADQEHIFERFFRAANEETRRAQGSGLGLPIARAMVELHGGTLTVESVAGAGAAFRIDLPCTR